MRTKKDQESQAVTSEPKGAARKKVGEKQKKPRPPRIETIDGPYKLTPDRVDRLINAITVGLTIKRACLHAGIDTATYDNWVRRGEDDRSHLRKTKLAEFKERLDEAMVAAELISASRILEAAQDGDWQAASWILRFRFKWGQDDSPQKVQISGPNGGPIYTEATNVNANVDLTNKTTEKLTHRLTELLAVARQRRGEPEPTDEPDEDETTPAE